VNTVCKWLFCLSFASAGLLAQSPAPAGVPVKDAPAKDSIVLRGRVIDLKTGEPISKALVSIRAQNLQTATDENGRFELTGVAPGEADLYVSTIDYGLLKQHIQVDAAANPELELLLGQEALKHTERITVTSAPFAPVVAEAPVEHSITNTELKNLSMVMLDDPIRAVQNMPGVAADNESPATSARPSCKGAPTFPSRACATRSGCRTTSAWTRESTRRSMASGPRLRFTPKFRT